MRHHKIFCFKFTPALLPDFLLEKVHLEILKFFHFYRGRTEAQACNKCQMVAHEVKDIELNREIFDIDDEATENPSASGLNEPETEMALHRDGISSSPTPPAAAVIAVAAALNSNKGQLISEENCGVLNFPKKTHTKNSTNFCPK